MRNHSLEAVISDCDLPAIFKSIHAKQETNSAWEANFITLFQTILARAEKAETPAESQQYLEQFKLLLGPDTRPAADTALKSLSLEAKTTCIKAILQSIKDGLAIYIRYLSNQLILVKCKKEIDNQSRLPNSASAQQIKKLNTLLHHLDEEQHQLIAQGLSTYRNWLNAHEKDYLKSLKSMREFTTVNFSIKPEELSLSPAALANSKELLLKHVYQHPAINWGNTYVNAINLSPEIDAQVNDFAAAYTHQILATVLKDTSAKAIQDQMTQLEQTIDSNIKQKAQAVVERSKKDNQTLSNYKENLIKTHWSQLKLKSELIEQVLTERPSNWAQKPDVTHALYESIRKTENVKVKDQFFRCLEEYVVDPHITSALLANQGKSFAELTQAPLAQLNLRKLYLSLYQFIPITEAQLVLKEALLKWFTDKAGNANTYRTEDLEFVKQQLTYLIVSLYQAKSKQNDESLASAIHFLNQTLTAKQKDVLDLSAVYQTYNNAISQHHVLTLLKDKSSDPFNPNLQSNDLTADQHLAYYAKLIYPFEQHEKVKPVDFNNLHLAYQHLLAAQAMGNQTANSMLAVTNPLPSAIPAKANKLYHDKLLSFKADSPYYQEAQFALALSFYRRRYQQIYSNPEERLIDLYRMFQHLANAGELPEQLTHALGIVKPILNDSHLEANTYKLLLAELAGEDPLNPLYPNYSNFHHFTHDPAELKIFLQAGIKPTIQSDQLLQAYLNKQGEFVATKFKVYTCEQERDGYSLRLTADELNNFAKPILFLDTVTHLEVGRFYLQDGRLHFEGRSNKVHLTIDGNLHLDNYTFESVDELQLTADFDNTNLHVVSEAPHFGYAGNMRSSGNIQIEALDQIHLNPNSTIHCDHQLSLFAANMKLQGGIIADNVELNLHHSLESFDGSVIHAQSGLFINADTVNIAQDSKWSANQLGLSAQTIENNSPNLLFDVAQIHADDKFVNHKTGKIQTKQFLQLTGENAWNQGQLQYGKQLQVNLNKLFVNGVASTAALPEVVNKQNQAFATISGQDAKITSGCCINLAGALQLRDLILISLAELNAGIMQTANCSKTRLMSIDVGSNLPNLALYLDDLNQFIQIMQNHQYEKNLAGLNTETTNSGIKKDSQFAAKVASLLLPSMKNRALFDLRSGLTINPIIENKSLYAHSKLHTDVAMTIVDEFRESHQDDQLSIAATHTMVGDKLVHSGLDYALQNHSFVKDRTESGTLHSNLLHIEADKFKTSATSTLRANNALIDAVNANFEGQQQSEKLLINADQLRIGPTSRTQVEQLLALKAKTSSLEGHITTDKLVSQAEETTKVQGPIQAAQGYFSAGIALTFSNQISQNPTIPGPSSFTAIAPSITFDQTSELTAEQSTSVGEKIVETGTKTVKQDTVHATDAYSMRGITQAEQVNVTADTIDIEGRYDAQGTAGNFNFNSRNTTTSPDSQLQAENTTIKMQSTEQLITQGELVADKVFYQSKDKAEIGGKQTINQATITAPAVTYQAQTEVNEALAIKANQVTMSEQSHTRGAGDFSVSAHSATFNNIDTNGIDVALDTIPKLDDFLMQRGIYRNVKAKERLNLTTLTPVNLTNTLELPYSFNLIAPSITITAPIHGAKDLGFTATAGSIANTQITLSANGSLLIDANQNYTNDRGSLTGIEGLYIHAKDTATNYAGTWSSPNYVQVITDQGDIINEASQTAIQGRFGLMQQYHPAQILGGIGNANQGYGLYMHAGGKILNDASNIYSIGNNYLAGDLGIESEARYNQYQSYYKKHRKWNGTKVTKEYSWQTQAPLIYSVQGQNNLISQQGGIYSLSSDLFARDGNSLSAKEDVLLTGLVLEKRCDKKSNYFGGLARNHHKEKHDMNVPTFMVDYKDTFISSLNDVKLLNALVVGAGNLTLNGKHVILDRPILNHSTEDDNWGFGISTPGLSLLPSYSLYQDLQALKSSHHGIEQLANLWNTGLNGINTFNTMMNAYRNNSPLALFNPSIELSYTHTNQKARAQTLAENVGITRDGSLVISAENEIAFLNTVAVQIAADASLTAKHFIQQGAALKNSQQTDSEKLTVGVNLSLEPTAGAGVNFSRSKQVYYANQQFTVGGNLETKLNQWDMNAANVVATSWSGNVGKLAIISPLNTSSSMSASLEANTGGFLNAQASQSRSGVIGTPSGIHTQVGINAANDQPIHVGSTYLEGAKITTAGVNRFETDTLTTKVVNEFGDGLSFGIAGNVNDLMGAGSQALPNMNTQIALNDYRAKQYATIYSEQGTHINARASRGDLNTTNADGLKVKRETNFNVNVKVPIYNASGMKQFSNNLIWLREQMQTPHQQTFPNRIPEKKPFVKKKKPKVENNLMDDATLSSALEEINNFDFTLNVPGRYNYSDVLINRDNPKEDQQPTSESEDGLIDNYLKLDDHIELYRKHDYQEQLGNKIIGNLLGDPNTIAWEDPNKDLARKYLYLHPNPNLSSQASWTSAGSKNWDEVIKAAEVKDYQKKWNEIKAEMDSIAKLADPLERNKRITAAYNMLYETNHKLLWAKVAYYASKQVGCGISHANGVPFIGKEAATILGNGNKAVFEDIYPMLSFYNKYGLTDLKTSLVKPTGNQQTIINALEKIDKGDLDKGTDDILDHEQRNILQKMYAHPQFSTLVKINHIGNIIANAENKAAKDLYDMGNLTLDPDMWKAAPLNALIGMLVTKSIQPEKVSLTPYCNGGLEHNMSDIDIRDFNQRMHSARKLVKLVKESELKKNEDDRHEQSPQTMRMKKAC